MAKKCLVVKQRRDPKYKVRKYHRCRICGRPRGFLRRYDMCRICFRQLAHQGFIPGVKKASW